MPQVSQYPSGAPALGSDEIYVERGGVGGVGGVPRRLSIDDVLALSSRPNAVVNGAFDHARYAASQALTTAAAYGSLDRWWAMQFTAANGTLSQVAATVTGFKYAAKLQRAAGSANVGTMQCGQAFETLDCLCFAGKTVTLSAWMRKGANFSAAANELSMAIDYGTGVDQSSALQSQGTWTGHVQNNQAKVLTAGDVQHSWTVAIPANATQIGVRFFFVPTGVAGADDSVTIHGVKFERGLVASPPAPSILALDLALCLRWMFKTFPYATPIAQNSGVANGAISYIAVSGGGNPYHSVHVRYPVQMRASPTVTFYNPNAANANWRNFNLGADSSASAAAALTPSENGFSAQNQQVAGDLASHTLGIHAVARVEL